MPDYQPTGRCFDDALDLLAEMERKGEPLDEYRLVHGICIADNEPYAHAWVEREDEIIMAGLVDGQRMYFMCPRAAFVDEMRPQKVTRYSRTEWLHQNALSGHFGPWEPEYVALASRRKVRAHGPHAEDGAFDAHTAELVFALAQKLDDNRPPGIGFIALFHNEEGTALNTLMFSSNNEAVEVEKVIRATLSRLALHKDPPPKRRFALPMAEGSAPHGHLVTSLTIESRGGHDRVNIWTRGALAGELILDAGDGEAMAKALKLELAEVEDA